MKVIPVKYPLARLRRLLKHRLQKIKMINGVFCRRLAATLTEDQRGIVNSIPPGSLVFDIGANIGEFSNLFASLEAQVFAFEPNPAAFKTLTQRRLPGVLALNVAADVCNEKKLLFNNPKSIENAVEFSQASSLMSAKPNVSELNCTQIEAVDLAALINALPHELYLIKIDIEGYEVELLPHLLATGALEKVKYCFVETHERQFPALAVRTEEMKQRICSSDTKCNVLFDWH